MREPLPKNDVDAGRPAERAVERLAEPCVGQTAGSEGSGNPSASSGAADSPAPPAVLSITVNAQSLPVKRIAIVVAAVLAALLLLVVYFDEIWSFLGFAVSVASPFVIGAALAYLLNIIMSRLERVYFPNSENKVVLRTRRVACLILSLCVVAAVMALVGWLVSGQLKDSAGALFQGVSAAISALVEIAEDHDLDTGIMAVFGKDITQWETLLGEAVNKMGGVDNMISQAVGFGGALTGSAVNALIAFVFALYLLASKEKALAGARTFAHTILPEAWYEHLCHVVEVADECFSRFIAGQCLEAMILGSLCALGMTLLSFPHALTIGVCVGLFSLVPLIGAWIGGIVGVLMILPYSFEQAVFFVVFLLVLQQIEGHFIYPKTVGTAVGVSSIWVLVAVFVGGALLGVPGILLGVPFVATASRLLEDFWSRPAASDHA